MGSERRVPRTGPQVPPGDWQLGVTLPTFPKRAYKTPVEHLWGYAMNLLWGLVVVLVVLWLLGFSLHVGGGLIHLLLVIAVIVIVVRLVTGRGV
jgi:hypothetical protein